MGGWGRKEHMVIIEKNYYKNLFRVCLAEVLFPLGLFGLSILFARSYGQ